MIKLYHEVLPSADQTMFVIEGMRNPMNSWALSDSFIFEPDDPVCKCHDCVTKDELDCLDCDVFLCEEGDLYLGIKDEKLMMNLAKAGPEHRKYLRMLPVYVRINAPFYWWKEFDTYKVGTVANSCSTMHKLTEKMFSRDQFSLEKLTGERLEAMDAVIFALNKAREQYLESGKKEDWDEIVQMLPSSYNQIRNVMLNYEVLRTIYCQRKGHKLEEWRIFCRWIEQLPYSGLITGDETDNQKRQGVK